jgi:hypothetical protein
MTGFLNLPTEIRMMIYGHAFHNQTVKFQSDFKDHDKNAPLAACAALLTSCKTIYAEAQPVFHQNVLIDLSGVCQVKGNEIRSSFWESLK